MNPLERLVRAITAREFRSTREHELMCEVLIMSLAGAGFVSPNPFVGALVLADGAEVGRGVHRIFGEEHAERAALNMARQRAQGGEIFVNLEPCNHEGNQPPCTKAIIEAGIRRVIFGGYDPNPLTSRQARPVLEEAGVEVVGPLMAFATARLNDSYYHWHYCERPLVTLKLAVSLEGRLSAASGDSQWISGKVGRGYGHFLRQTHDAVVVGVGTVLADNPRLTVRGALLAEFMGEYRHRLKLRQPARVILDPGFELFHRREVEEELEKGLREEAEHLDTPPLNIFRKGMPVRGEIPWLIIAGRAGAAPAGVRLLPGVALLELEDKHRLSFDELWEKLGSYGIRSVLVEGGARVARELIQQRAFTRLDLVIAPVLLGEDGLGFSPVLGLKHVEDGPDLKSPIAVPLGKNVLVSGYRTDWLVRMVKGLGR
ncbi:MAG: riboflavin biosynthesis protein RibD [Planctomycetales bacterium 4484_113]|nr:MAG: riboflavin biosynthesis protein RibD [Planctomycetales bacterium 4484_113]